MRVSFRPEKQNPPRNGPLSLSSGPRKRVTLKPGSWLISDRDLAILQGHPSYEALVKHGVVKVMGEPETVDPAPSGESLDQFNVDDAQEVIEGTVNLDELQGWLKAEKRVTVQRAINTRIKQIREGAG